jgi:hypothetical protein
MCASQTWRVIYTFRSKVVSNRLPVTLHPDRPPPNDVEQWLSRKILCCILCTPRDGRRRYLQTSPLQSTSVPLPTEWSYMRFFFPSPWVVLVIHCVLCMWSIGTGKLLMFEAALLCGKQVLRRPCFCVTVLRWVLWGWWVDAGCGRNSGAWTWGMQ